MAKLYGASLLRIKPVCLQNGIAVVSVSLVGLGCFLVLFVTATFQNDAWSNTALSTFFLLGNLGSGALRFLGSFHQNLRVERVAVRRAQRGETRKS